MSFVRSAALLTLLAAPALAQGPTDGRYAYDRERDRDRDRSACEAQGPRPYVCDVDLELVRSGERSRRLSLARPIALVPTQRIEIALTGIDQFGREFPAERAAYGFTPGRDCRDLLEVSELGRDRYRVAAGTRRGSCEVLVWVAGNLNLEWPLRFDIEAVASRGYDREQAEVIARRLYRAILGRDAEPAGLYGAATEIERGRLETQVAGMFESAEFADKRSSLSTEELLESFYRGLLDRRPDSLGWRSFRDDLARGRTTAVVLAILRSEEFEQKLVIEATEKR
jgi:hypothetical protein